MKQQITYEQFDKLTINQQEKLLDWSMDKQFGQSELESWNYWELTIGQMIEFLDEHGVDWHYASFEQTFPDFEETDCERLKTDLCDDLWEYVVEVLEKV